MRLLKYILLTVSGLVVIAIIVFFIVFSVAFRSIFLPQFDSADYPNVVAERANVPTFPFLPKHIDSRAEKIGFYHIPGFAQGGDIICLRLKLPRKVIEEYFNEEKSTGKIPVNPSVLPTGIYRAYPPYGPVKLTKENFFNQIKDLPSTFSVFLTADTDLATIHDHGSLAFTAISVEDEEVVYYASEW